MARRLKWYEPGGRTYRIHAFDKKVVRKNPNSNAEWVPSLCGIWSVSKTIFLNVTKPSERNVRCRKCEKLQEKANG